MQAGKYQAKIVDYGVSTSKSGDPNIFVQFQTAQGEKITWWGGLKTEQNVEITLKTAFSMGFRKDDLAVLSDGLKSSALNTAVDYEIVVEDAEWQGKKKLRIKYINVPGAGGSFERLSRQEAVTKLSGFKGHIMALKQDLGLKDEPAKAQNDSADDSDIPF